MSLGAQLIGSALGAGGDLVGGLMVFGVLKAAMGLRLSPEEEHEGADLAIHKIGSTPEREVNW